MTIKRNDCIMGHSHFGNGRYGDDHSGNGHYETWKLWDTAIHNGITRTTILEYGHYGTQPFWERIFWERPLWDTVFMCHDDFCNGNCGNDHFGTRPLWDKVIIAYCGNEHSVKAILGTAILGAVIMTCEH